MSPKGPGGNFKHQSARVSMASIYSSHWNGRTGNTKGVIAGAPAFLTSAAGTLELQSNLLKELGSHPDPNMEKLLTMWQAELGIKITVDFPTHIQSKRDQPLLKKTSSDLFHPLTEKHDQARWRAVTAQHAGDWLHSLPITSCGMRLSDEALRVAVGLRLGANICKTHTCSYLY